MSESTKNILQMLVGNKLASAPLSKPFPVMSSSKETNPQNKEMEDMTLALTLEQMLAMDFGDDVPNL